MGNTSSRSSRVDSDSSPKHNTKHSKEKVAPTMWKTAPSLRPNTVLLALACMQGDKEAEAIRDAYQFQTSRATRLVQVSREDFAAAETDQGIIFEHAGAGGGLASPQRLWIKVPETIGQIKASLNSALVEFQRDRKEGETDLWNAIYLFARSRTEYYKQKTIRDAENEQDFVSGFTLHAMKQVSNGKYEGPQAFSHWLEVVYRNFANDFLSDFTEERNDLVGLALYSDGELEPGYVSERENAVGEWLNDDGGKRPSYAIDALVRDMAPADRAYAMLAMLGFNQKQIAEKQDVSLPTARKSKERLIAVLAPFVPSPTLAVSL